MDLLRRVANVPRFTSATGRVAALGGLLCLTALSSLSWLIASAPPAAAAAATVRVLHLDGEVNSVSADYLASALTDAGRAGAGAVVIETNTPGGISSAMDQMESAILNAPVPVAVYVAPTGSRAASAGLFVAQAADVVAMAPGTNIGSAHPVTGSGGDIGGDLGRKVLNDAVARIRNLAALHHRNADWSERAVRDSVNIGADEAVRIGVADLEPATLPALLEALDGRPAPRPSGPALTLTFHTAGATIVDQPMSVFQLLLQALIDPNVAYLLVLVAIFGLIAEVTSPGAILPGVVGGLSAILALVALSTLPINLAGALLLGFAFLLFVADIKAPTHGILTVGGLISLLLGSAFLLNTGGVDIGIDWRLILAAAAAIALGFALVLRKAVRARSQWIGTRGDALVGSLGEARGALSPTGPVFVAGAIWPASTSSAPIASGQTIRVVGQEPAGLLVEPASPGQLQNPVDAADPADPAGPHPDEAVPAPGPDGRL
jgi:membrane-bound serine protease (ClpP class)